MVDTACSSWTGHFFPFLAFAIERGQVLEFIVQLEIAVGRQWKPVIRYDTAHGFAHRDRYEREGGGQQAVILNKADAEKMFEPISAVLKKAGLRATVFFWDELHDRFLITDLLGINAPYGFDITRNVALQDTVWTRLSLADRDSFQREFDRNSTMHTLQLKIEIGR